MPSVDAHADPVKQVVEGGLRMEEAAVAVAGRIIGM